VALSYARYVFGGVSSMARAIAAAMRATGQNSAPGPLLRDTLGTRQVKSPAQVHCGINNEALGWAGDVATHPMYESVNQSSCLAAT